MDLQKQKQVCDATDIVVPLTALRRDALALVGGKGANLGELIGAGLPVPSGFCITTVAYEMIASEAGLEAILDAHSTGDSKHLAEAARNCLLDASILANVTGAITEAYRVLGTGKPIPVAVRSSATAEDLPFASFAGQQETYLNTIGIEAVLDAVRRCWASLWTDRAVSYRASLGIDQRTVRLAVVVQHMIECCCLGCTLHGSSADRQTASGCYRCQSWPG